MLLKRSFVSVCDCLALPRHRCSLIFGCQSARRSGAQACLVFANHLVGILSSSLAPSPTEYTRAYLPSSRPCSFIQVCSQFMVSSPWHVSVSVHAGTIGTHLILVHLHLLTYPTGALFLHILVSHRACPRQPRRSVVNDMHSD
jgi:hypothetical protein